MENLKLVHQLFIGKVADEIGMERTTELLKESKEAFAIPVVVRSEQLPCSQCGRPLKEHSKDSRLCPDRMKNFEQGN